MRERNKFEEVPSIELTDEELSMASAGKPLNLDGIEGESRDSKKLNSIEINSFGK
jgi:hypothetical protein